MTKIKLFVIIFITTCVCTGSAIVRPKHETTPNPTTNILNSINLTVSRRKDNIIIERLRKSMESNETSEFCGEAPCGWCPYDELQNTSDFIHNRCECRNSQRCLRERPNYSGSYYVYYCNDKALEDDYYDSCIPEAR